MTTYDQDTKTTVARLTKGLSPDEREHLRDAMEGALEALEPQGSAFDNAMRARMTEAAALLAR